MREENRENELIHKLDRFIRKYYTNLIVKGSLSAVAILGFSFLLINLLEYFGRFNGTIRAILFFAFVGVALFVVARWVVIPLLKLNKLGKVISHEQAARIIGKHFPQVSDKLLNTLQLRQLATNHPGDTSLLLASIDQKSSELRPVPFTDAIDISQNRRYLKYALPPLLLIIIFLFIAPQLVKDPSQRLVFYNQEFAEPAPFRFELMNDNLEIPRQESFQVEMKIEGEVLPSEAFIQTEQGRFKMNKREADIYTYTFKNVQGNRQFHFSANGFNSDSYELKALPNPVLLGFEVEMDYPGYTGWEDKKQSNTGNLRVPEGSSISWFFSTEDTEQLTVNFPDTIIDLEQSGENSFQYKRTFMEDATYSVSTRNNHVQSKDSLPFKVDVIPDGYPNIEVDERRDSTNERLVYFQGRASDDYGLSSLYFNYRFVKKGDEQVQSPETKRIPVSIDAGQTETSFYHFWDLTRLKIEAGDQITYYFEVWDNDGVNGSKSARTSTKTFAAPTEEQLERKKEKTDEQIAKELDKSLRQASELRREIEDIQKDLVNKKEIGWQEKQRIEKMLNKQRDLQRSVENLRKQQSQMNKQMQEYSKRDKRIAEKQKQLEKLMDDIMSEEMKEMMRKLEEMMSQLDKEEIQEQMEKMKMSSEQMEKEIDRTLEVFKRMEVEQKMQQAIDKLEKLAEKQEKLADKTSEHDKSEEGKENKKDEGEKEKTGKKNEGNKKEGDKEEGDKKEGENKDGEKQGDQEKKDGEKKDDKKGDSLSNLEKEQEELNQEFDSLKKDMEDIQKKNEDLQQPMDLPDDQESQENISQEMQESSDQLQQQKPKDASEHQKNASDQMKKMAGQMQMAMGQMQMQQMQEDMKALRALLQNLIHVSFDQERIMNELSETKDEDPRYVDLGQQQKKLQKDSEMIEDSLFALSKRVPQLEAVVNREISKVNMNMQNSIENISERQTGKATSKQQYVMTSYNNLALMLDEVLQQMQMQMASQMPGTGNCQKPGGMGKGQKPSAQQLRQMQEALSKKMQQMQKMLDQQGGKKPGKQGKGGRQLSKELAKMAAEQEAIRREIQRISNELNEQGQGAGNQLKRIAEEMEKTEEDLVNKRITNETLKRQREITTRLLEHEKAEKKRKFDNKREAREAENIERADPKEFFEYQKKKEQEVELLRTIPPDLMPYYRNKVNEYFSKFGR